MAKKKVLLIGGSLNQTKITHAVGKHLESSYGVQIECYYTPGFCDGVLEIFRRLGWLEFTVIGDRIRKRSEAYLKEHGLNMDYGGVQHDYDLIVTTTDIIIQRKLKGKPVILIQEGMTDPEDWRFHLVKKLGLPRWIAGTSTAGLSDHYQYFCVASPGYRDLFIQKGCKPEKILVTGLPNFDHVAAYNDNGFPHKDYVLVATSNARETFKPDDRQKFLHWAMEKAAGRPVIFKLHPNENVERATNEIRAHAPDALVLAEGNTDHMIANSAALVTQYSTCIYVGLALGKECHSYFDIEELSRLTPIQNGGSSGEQIARLCARVLEELPATAPAGAHPIFNRFPQLSRMLSTLLGGF